jgi:uncharacterized protein with HEPN domain
MTRHDDKISLRHMLDHAREVAVLLERKSRRDLHDDRLLSLAVVRLLEIIGEAAARLDKTTRDRHPRIGWKRIVGLRSRLIHAYDTVDLDILWNITQKDIPALIQELEIILSS